ncbi:hypothetical protein K8354_17385 [Polaribacter litorisediminis]|uniref:hypothetical protein n=1 Tax=Polaribacter litorisediminis TaxID=1908341 RepID=UPI001CBD02B0|nr:hypothetical protein [Polaribacter litorisediminis]UAM98033.1 hypothetical protein K8354_17385 [Polaribacter litorisediminis]
MKKLKKNLFSALLVCSMALGIAFSFVPNEANAFQNECTSEQIDCPGWGTGDRTICHVNGNGVGCNCGDSTTCGDKPVITQAPN